MSILFLDFDGVLHPDAVYLEKGKPVLRGHPGIALFEWAPILADLLAPHPAVKIVLSTSWVPSIRFHESKARLPDNLQARVVGATWHSKYVQEYGLNRIAWLGMTRFDQIQMYVRRHCRDGKWLAIDDHDTGWPDDQRHHLVQTESELGIAPQAVRDEIRERLTAVSEPAQ